MCKYGQAFTGIGTNSHLLQCRSFPDLREAACFNVSFFVIAVYFENACCVWLSATENNNKSNNDNFPTATRTKTRASAYPAS